MLCDQIGISRANLYRKIKAISELSPTELIRNKRLEVALRYLKETNMSVSEVATLLGFNSHSYFSNSFKSVLWVHTYRVRTDEQCEQREDVR